MNGHIKNAENALGQNSIHSCKPRLIGTTGKLYSSLVAPSKLNEPTTAVSSEHETTSFNQPTGANFSTESSNFFKSLQWSTDGTTLLTTSADSTLRSFVLPPTLLEPPHPHPLKPHITHILPEPAYATAVYPSYNLANTATCLLLASLRNLPVRLYSSLGGGVLGSYPLISPTTEAYIAPHSLLFASSRPNEFFAGSNGVVATFDVNRPGEGPVETMRTGRKQRARSGAPAIVGEAGNGLRGIVSAMDMSRDGLLAAGTFESNVGLYDDHGYGKTNAIFSHLDENDNHEAEGNGITQVIWDESGRYLCVAERGSDGISIWDIRGTGKRLAWLQGRKAKTQQRMGVEVMNGEAWAGGTDGVMRVWEGLGMKEGAVERDWEFEAHEDVVSGVGLHPGGSVLATCSGQRHYPVDDQWEAGRDDDSGSESSASQRSLSSRSSVSVESQASEGDLFDNSLRIWVL